jgi:hypothetical protein
MNNSSSPNLTDVTDSAFCINSECSKAGYCTKFLSRVDLSIIKMEKNDVMIIAMFDDSNCNYYVINQ